MGAETGILGTWWPARLPETVAPGSVKDFVSKIKVDTKLVQVGEEGVWGGGGPWKSLDRGLWVNSLKIYYIKFLNN